jgi:glycosyltransferase involved in cell wall biosynthesis
MATSHSEPLSNVSDRKGSEQPDNRPRASVCAICLYSNRPQYIHQSVKCFLDQTYTNKHLLIFDNGPYPVVNEFHGDNIILVHANSQYGKSIGELRNIANSFAGEEILMHWDVDDWSHRLRMAEQVEVLENNPNAQVTGYRSLPFWNEELKETWVYSGTMLGTSLCYRKSTWEQHKFQHTSSGEDTQFLFGLVQVPSASPVDDPRMVARIHPGNTSASYDPEKMKNCRNWQMVI